MQDKLSALSDHALAQLKDAVDAEMEVRRGRLFRVGSLAKFESSKRGGTVFIRITGRGSKNIIGDQVDEFGRLMTNAFGRAPKWRVHPQFLSPAVPKPIVAPSTKPTSEMATAGGTW